MHTKFSVRLLLLAVMILAIPASSPAGIVFSIGIAPPPLPVYVQPLCPGNGYIWTPGYWAYSDDGGYFWVPGTWVLAPEIGFLWTPGYWGWGDGLYIFHRGYWGSHIGFYGGINYGFGYGGFGYEGGYWRNGGFFYNRSVNNVTNVTNVYNKTVIVNNNVRNVSYNGGQGGVSVRPTPEEGRFASERHIEPTSSQTQHVQVASANRQLYHSANHGSPAIAATARPGEFGGAGATNRPSSPTHPRDLTPIGSSVPNGLRARQEQDRQRLQQKQEQEHQRLDQRKAPEPQRQRMEQQHQQQTQHLEQKHAQQQQRVQQRESRPRR